MDRIDPSFAVSFHSHVLTFLFSSISQYKKLFLPEETFHRHEELANTRHQLLLKPPLRDLQDEDDTSDESYEEDAYAELRGLESIARLDSARIQQRRAVSIVLRRQLIGKIDEAWLALVYRPFSEAAARLAYRRGLRDQEVAPSPVPKQKVMIR